MKSQNGHEISKRFLMRLNLQQFADPGDPDAGNNVGAGDNAPGGNDQSGTEPGTNGDGGDSGEDAKAAMTAELERLKADMAKQKKALDDATKEAGNLRKELRSRQTQEEIDAQAKREAEEKAAQELEELRKEVARAKSTKAVMSKLGVEEEAAGKIAECLFGCENIEAALLEIQKVWTAKEKALRLEFGKIPGPGAGGSGDENTEEKAAIERARKLGRERADAGKSVSDALSGYMR